MQGTIRSTYRSRIGSHERRLMVRKPKAQVVEQIGALRQLALGVTEAGPTTKPRR